MKKTRLLLVSLACVAFFAISAPSAFAAPSCGTHKLVLGTINLGTNTFSGNWDFKCGGAESGNNGDWYIKYSVQNYDGQTSSWFTMPCQNGSPCTAQRPSGGGVYNGGTEHADVFTFHPDVLWVGCDQFRVRAVVVFPFFPDSVVYTSQTYTGCP